MNRSTDKHPATNFYDVQYNLAINSGTPPALAQTRAVEAYLDGKPRLRGKKKTTRTERDAAFWSSALIEGIPAAAWGSDGFLLALSRYFEQERVSNAPLLERIASTTPDVLRRAARHSGLVLRPGSPRRQELAQLAGVSSVVAELCEVFAVFDKEHEILLDSVASEKQKLSELSPFEMLIYASLYAFEHLVYGYIEDPIRSDTDGATLQAAWEAINKLLIWKLSTAPEGTVKQTEAEIGPMVQAHLAPFLFPSRTGQARHDLRDAFEALVKSQINLDSFINYSADAFSYDEACQFHCRGDRLVITETDSTAREAWMLGDRKLAQLHVYWHLRAVEAFLGSGMDTVQIGRAENSEANRVAFLFTFQTFLQLQEVYGLDENVITDNGDGVDLFQALLSLSLMSTFYRSDFLEVFSQKRSTTDSWISALSQLAFDGLAHGMKNRLPLTWSNREEKINNIIGWTVTEDSPHGSARDAAAILDFWTCDWLSESARLRDGSPGISPELFERPVLKMGQLLVQLPWLVGMQNNSTAAINNLRRLGQRRGEAKSETQRIEKRLSELFESRGFVVALNWIPPVGDGENPGEVDLVCAKDGSVLVLELKSTFIRRSQREAWFHSTTTLRKAGQQLKRKLVAVQTALSQPSDLMTQFGLENTGPVSIHAWIVDTSIEADHLRFNDFLKISLEEVLIALRDERHFLNEPASILANPEQISLQMERTLYPRGFNVSRFIEVIENALVWEGCGIVD